MFSILLIVYVRSNGDEDEKTMKCIAGKSQLYVSRLCGHCANQKAILGEYLDYFGVTDCIEERDKCIEEGIEQVPTWVIGEKRYADVFSVEELKNLTAC